MIAGANGPDTKLLGATLAAVVLDRPAVADQEQPRGLDQGDDNPTDHAAVAKQHDVPHIRRLGEVATARKHKKSKPRRRVVERMLAGLGCQTAAPCSSVMTRTASILSDAFPSPGPDCGLDALIDFRLGTRLNGF